MKNLKSNKIKSRKEITSGVEGKGNLSLWREHLFICSAADFI